MNLEKVNLEEINKFLITGYEEKILGNVTPIFDKLGVTFANKSKNEKLSPSEISTTILKSKKKFSKNELITQEKVSQVWNTLALDLFMGNLEQENWYWSDVNALPLLDFWKNLDEQLGFVLVFDEPHKALQRYLDTLKEGESVDTAKILDKWKHYNQAMLNFFYKNQDKALLIHSEAIVQNSEKYLETFKNQVGFKALSFKDTSNKDEYTTYKLISKNVQHEKSNSAMYIIEDILSQRVDVLDLYNELQSVANTYSEKELVTKKDANLALNELIMLKHSKETTTKTTTQLQNEKEALSKQLDKVKAELSKSDLENNNLKTKTSILEKDYKQVLSSAKQNDKSSEAEEDNEPLLTQLHHVQEELEKYYLENQRLKEKEPEKTRYYGAADRIKNHLGYKLGAKMIEKSKSFFGILGLPFSLIAIHSEYKKGMKAKKGKKLPPIESYADAYDAQRVKNHLSYMLGETMIKTFKNPLGIFLLPFKLSATYKAFKKSKS